MPKLREAIKKSNARWKIAYGHRPLFSDGAHGDNPQTIDALEIDAYFNDVRAYIANQPAHHAKHTFQDEYRRLLEAHRLEWDERYLWD